MQYIIRFFVAMAVIFMFAMNMLSVILLWGSLSELLLILWLVGSYILLILELDHFELIVATAKKLLMVLATDTICYYKKGGLHE